jgi:hypothetical protein
VGQAVLGGVGGGAGKKPAREADAQPESQLPLLKGARDGLEPVKAAGARLELTGPAAGDLAELIAAAPSERLTMNAGPCTVGQGESRYSHWFGVHFIGVPGGRISSKVLFNLNDSGMGRVVQQVHDFQLDAPGITPFHTGPRGIITFDLDRERYLDVSAMTNAGASETASSAPATEAQKRIFSQMMMKVLPAIQPYIPEEWDGGVRAAEAAIFRGFVEDLCRAFGAEKPPDMESWGQAPPRKKPRFLPGWAWRLGRGPERKRLGGAGEGSP